MLSLLYHSKCLSHLVLSVLFYHFILPVILFQLFLRFFIKPRSYACRKTLIQLSPLLSHASHHVYISELSCYGLRALSIIGVFGLAAVMYVIIRYICLVNEITIIIKKKIRFLNRKMNLLISNIHQYRLNCYDPSKRIYSVHIIRLQNAYYSLNTFFCCCFIPLNSMYVYVCVLYIGHVETSNLFVLPVVYILNKVFPFYFFILVNIHLILYVTEKYDYRRISVTRFKN